MYHTLYVMYMPHFFYPFICLWTLGFLLPWHFVLLGIKSWVPIQLAWPYMIWSLTITLASLHNKLLFTAPQPHSPALQGGFLLSLQDSRTSLWGSSWLLSRFLTQGHPHTSLLRALPWPPNLTPTASAPPPPPVHCADPYPSITFTAWHYLCFYELITCFPTRKKLQEGRDFVSNHWVLSIWNRK